MIAKRRQMSAGKNATPEILYWASGSAPAATRWSPMDPARSLYRPAPGPLPSWAQPDYVEHNVAEFQRTGFHGGLNYYRAAEPYVLSLCCVQGREGHPAFFLHGGERGRSQGELYLIGGAVVFFHPIDTVD